MHHHKVRALGGLLVGLGFWVVSSPSKTLAQYPVGAPGEVVTYETVAPGQKTVTYGERVKVRYRPNKTVIRERPTRYVTTTPPVVRETRVVRPAPLAEQIVVQPQPVVEERWVQPAPVLERRVIQPAPVVQTRLIPQDPVVRTRYLGAPPY